MKNQILFVLLLLCSFSCTKSDNDQPNINEKILGEWLVNSFVINSCPDASDNFPMVTADEDGCLDMAGAMNCMSIIFKEDGKAENRSQWSNESTDVQTMTYHLNEANNSVSLCIVGSECIDFYLEGDGLFNDMDEQGCICTFGFKKS
jgi:hypothetical protein